jgi:hypothetical protein
MDLSSLFQPANMTAAGGIVLAIILAAILYKIVGNHINHNTQAVMEWAKNTAKNTEVLRGLADIIADLREEVRLKKR